MMVQHPPRTHRKSSASLLSRAATPNAVRHFVRRTEVRLLIGCLALMVGVWAFLALTGEVREQETTPFDRAVLLSFRTPADLATPLGPRWLQESARDVTALGGFTALALISVGAGNDYGHPRAVTLDMLRALRAPILRTDERGTILVSQGGEGLRVWSERPAPVEGPRATPPSTARAP